MIKLIIPSYRRPAQLYLLLESVRRFSKINFSITVLNKYHPNYSHGYDICREEFKCDIRIEEEFRRDFDFLVGSGGPTICIACDDNVLFRETPVVDKVRWGDVYSLRLGKNVRIQNYANMEPLPYPNNVIETDKLSWNPSGHGYYNWEYPFSLDFHIYNRDQLLSIMEEIQYNNTNSLEGNLMRYKHRILNMFSPLHSCSVNWPINNQSGLTTSQEISLDELNAKFVSGYKISLDRIIQENIIGCHQLLPLEWIKR